jgi:hypothetical protein
LALTSPTSGGRSVGIVRLRTKSHGVNLGTDFEYDFKRIIALLTSRQLGLMAGAVSLIVPVLNYVMFFGKLSFIPIVTQICRLM